MDLASLALFADRLFPLEGHQVIVDNYACLRR